MIESRKKIAWSYLSTWFAIDFFAIIPFDLILSTVSNADHLNSLVRVARMGKLYKLMKLMRLIRLLKVLKQKKKLVKSVQNFVSFGPGFERLMSFIAAVTMIVHIVSCLWVMTVSFTPTGNKEDKFEGTWMEGNEMGSGELYLTSFYYTVQTVTTVGYGDTSITSKNEKYFCILLMILGCISFAFSSGSLASIL